MLTLRPSATRGHANHGWLNSYHSFSFANYYDEKYMQYSVLRVINEDVISPQMGFGMHSHRDMEIVTYMLSGELRHTDSLGNGSVIKAGDVQRMTAGSGIRHSEANASAHESAHLLQIWLLPNALDLTPSYEEINFTPAQKHNKWCLLAQQNPATIDRKTAALHIHQDLQLFAAHLTKGSSLDYKLATNRCAYLQLAKGSLFVDGQTLVAGDAIMIEQQDNFTVTAIDDAEAILFDLPIQYQ